MAHSVFSPSGISSILACTPSLHVPIPKGGDGDNDYTREGDVAHQLIEMCGRARYACEEGEFSEEMQYPQYYLGTFCGSIEFTQEMVRDAELFLGEVARIMEANPGAKISFEERIVHGRVPEFGGTIDCLIITDVAIYILDFKFGAGLSVEVEENRQLLCYAILALFTHGKRERVEFTVVQPRRPHTDGPVRKWSPSYTEVREFGDVLLKCIQQYRERKARQDAGSPVHLELIDEYTPTTDNCRFCKVKANCPALQLMARKTVDQMEQDVNFDPEYLSWLLSNEAVIRKHIDACKVQAEAELRDLSTIPGFKLVERYGNRQWNGSAKSVLPALVASQPFAVTLWRNGKLVSPAQLEKQGVPREVFEHLVERPVTGTKVVPEDAPGQDLSVDHGAMFEEACSS